jgi:hypothetical protein
MSDELELAVKRGQLALRDGADWKQLVDALFHSDVEEVPQERPFPPVARHVDITADKVSDALMRLPEVWGSVEPKSRRALSAAENTAAAREREVLKTIKTALDARVEAINTTVKHHMDIQAEKEDRADPVTTLRDTKGHYALAKRGIPERSPIPGTNEAWSREYRSSGAELSAELLLEMYETDQISRADYLAFTRAARVVDEDKIMQALVEDPRRLEILFKIGAARPPVVQLFVRKQ